MSRENIILLVCLFAMLLSTFVVASSYRSARFLTDSIFASGTPSSCSILADCAVARASA